MILVTYVSTPVPCPVLEDPANGTVSLTGVSYGHRATYTCYSDYELVGANKLTCGDNGQWSADPPVCRRMYIGLALSPCRLSSSQVHVDSLTFLCA